MALDRYSFFRSKYEGALGAPKRMLNIAKQVYSQGYYLHDFGESITAPTGLFFEIVNFLKSYFFSNLPEAVVENLDAPDQIKEFTRTAIEDIANSLCYNKKLFSEVDKAILHCLIGGIGVVHFCPLYNYQTGAIEDFSIEFIDLKDLYFDPFLPLEENPVVILEKQVSVDSARERYGEEKIKPLVNPSQTRLALNFIYDLENAKYIVATKDFSTELEAFEFDPSLKDAFFVTLFFATPAGIYQYVGDSENINPYVSIYTTIQPQLNSYAILFYRYIKILLGLRSIGLVESSFQEILNALQLGEEGVLVPVSLQTFFNQIGNAPPFLFLPLEEQSRALAEIRQALMELEMQIRERVGIPDVQSTTKVTAENYIRITPFLIDARYANFIRQLDYFIARIYENYTRLFILTCDDATLLNKAKIDPAAIDPQIALEFLDFMRQRCLKPLPIAIETDSLSQQRQAKRALEMEKVVDTLISAISQVVNSVTANPAVAKGIAEALISLVDVYRMGKRYKETIRAALVGIAQSVPEADKGDPLVEIELQKLALKQAELQLKAQELDLMANRDNLNYQAKVLELQASKDKVSIDQQMKEVELLLKQRDTQIKELEAQVKAKKAETESAKELLMLQLEMQKLELEKLKAQVEAINKMADNIRLEQEAQIKNMLSDVQAQLLSKFTNTLPAINLNVPVPKRKVVRFVETPDGNVAADVENVFEDEEN